MTFEKIFCLIIAIVFIAACTCAAIGAEKKHKPWVILIGCVMFTNMIWGMQFYLNPEHEIKNIQEIIVVCLGIMVFATALASSIPLNEEDKFDPLRIIFPVVLYVITVIVTQKYV